jgi:hypothetical protein
LAGVAQLPYRESPTAEPSRCVLANKLFVVILLLKSSV